MAITALTLTHDQLNRMIAFVRAQVQAIEGERIQWIEERARAEREWKKDFRDRAAGNAVFSKSNESWDYVGDACEFITARMNEEIFGAQPYFSIDPELRKGDDPQLADQIRRHLEWKLGPKQANFQVTGREVINLAARLGECVVKIAYKEVKDKFERVASILFDLETGEPVVTADGDFVFEENGIESVAVGAVDGEGLEVSTLIATPKGHPDIELGTVDPVTGEILLSQRYGWRDHIVEDERVHYSGVKIFPLHYKEFYCPLNVPCIKEAQFVGHMTSMRLSQLRGMLAEMGEIGEETKTILSRLEHETTTPKNAAAEPKECVEGSLPDIADGDPQFKLLEAYFEFDARETGRPQRIYLLMAYDHDLPIYWDYIANVTPDGCYPFEVVRMIPEPFRWYGQPFGEKHRDAQILTDKLLNQIIYRNEMAANPIKFRRKEAVMQWEDDQELEVGPDKVYDLKDGYNANDALQTVELPQLDSQTRFLLETTIATWRTRTGITTATQGVFGDSPSEKTATGTNYIIQTGNTVFNNMAIPIVEGLSAVLYKAALYQYAYQDVAETFTYMEGDVSHIATLNPETIRGLKFDVRITMTNKRQSENLVKLTRGIEIADKFTTLQPEYQEVFAGLYGEILKNLGIDNAEEYFDKIVEINRQKMQAALAAQQGAVAPQLTDVPNEQSIGPAGPTEGFEPGAGASGEIEAPEGVLEGSEGLP